MTRARLLNFPSHPHARFDLTRPTPMVALSRQESRTLCSKRVIAELRGSAKVRPHKNRKGRATDKPLFVTEHN